MKSLVGIDHENKEIVVLFSGSLALVKHHNQLMQYTASLQSSNPKRPPSISSLSPIYQFLVDISSLEHQIQKLQPLPENIFSDKTGNIKINADYVDIYQHDGFGDGIQAALNLLLSVDKYPDHNIVFIGHSSGGSLASLALVDFSSSCGYSSKKSSPTLSLHTFGEPKAGNREYTNLVEKIVNNAGGHIFRSINRADPVPHLPPSLVPLDGSNTDSYSHYTATSTTAVWKHWSTGVNVYCQVNTENGQDVDCASLLHMNDLDIQDHFTYYGVSFQLQDHHHHSSSSTSSKTSSSASGSKPTSTPNEKQIARFDRVFFSRLYRLLAIMFRFRPTSSSSSSAHADSWIKRTWASLVNPKEDGSVAIYYLLLLLVSGANEVLVWFNGLSISEFYLCLDNRDFPAFRALIAKVTGLYVALSVAKSLLGFVGGMFAVRSRLRLTKCLQDGYIACSKSDKRSILYAILDSNQVVSLKT